MGLALFLGGWLIWSLATFAWSIPSRVYTIPTGSMAPTIKAGDRVAVDTSPRSRPRRGEIWVFRMPAASQNLPNIGIKRVIGLPGETVEVSSGNVVVNGQPLSEPYLAAPATYSMPPLTLGPAEYFVLGDSRDASHDSHVWGALPADHLIGKVMARYWPVKRIGGL